MSCISMRVLFVRRQWSLFFRHLNQCHVQFDALAVSFKQKGNVACQNPIHNALQQVLLYPHLQFSTFLKHFKKVNVVKPLLLSQEMTNN